MTKGRKLVSKIIILIVGFICIAVVGIWIFSRLDSAVTQNLDSYVYDLPYKNSTAHKVIQGYGGLFSHKHIAALDFDMPVGTEVYAARDGVVYGYKADSDEGGPFAKYKRKANYIIIQHPDGSFGCYWHLKKDGVVTKKGFVKKGQLIGYSGNTGFVLRRHLHFSVKRILNYDMDSFVRTRFRTANGIMLLENGESYQKPE